MNNSPVKIQVRFIDIDAMGHVNNAVYLSYFENARMYFFNDLLGEDWDWSRDGFILLNNEIQYLKPVFLKDEPEISVAVEKIGNKSFTLSYQLKVKDELRCIGSSVLVGYDNVIHSSILIPERMKAKLEQVKAEQ